MKIGNATIGKGNPCFIIAEAGVNHNGNMRLAKELVDNAVLAGADAIKFQTFVTEKLVTNYAEMAAYQIENLKKQDTQYDMLKKLELSYSDFKILKEYCDNKGIIFLSTPFDIESANFLNSLNVDAFKISSGDLTNIPLLEHISQFQKPIILSSGMSTLGDIEDALNALETTQDKNIAILHCTSNYPTAFEEVNLRAMITLANTFGVIGGYSDHTEGTLIPCLAVALGANIIEKHFTLDKTMEGPDHKASLEPDGLKAMIEGIRNTELSLGNGIKKITASESDTAKVARKSIIASCHIRKGEIITKEMLDYKRPGTGISPKFYKDIVGRKSRVDIEPNKQISYLFLE